MASMALGTALQQIHRLFHEGSVAALPDDQLLARFVTARDEVAFEALVARHGPMVLALCRSILKDEHAAEDAFQATFLVFARKAGSLWVHDTLGGWLHRVAYRIALRANADTRVRREKEATVVRSDRDGAWSDWIPVLHQEIDRMPDRHRAPIVLCDLQELTYEQAAQQLQWTVPTLRCRLAKAREQLRGRLTRRGLTGAGATLGVLLGSSAAKAAVPETWMQAATGAIAKGGSISTVSAFANALAEGMLRGILFARLKVAGLTLMVGVTAAVCVAAVALGQADDPPTNRGLPATTSPPPRAQATATPARAVEGEVLDYRGRVVGPDGRPVPGAKLFMVSSDDNESSRPRAMAGPDGRFAFAVDLARFDDQIYARHSRVAAAATGFGIGMTDSEAPDAGRDLTIRLTEDLPIEGRLVDMEGRPVAGASVRIISIWSSLQEDLDPWLAAIKARESDRYSLQRKYLSIKFYGGRRTTDAFSKSTTDPQGRFRLTGIGRERLADLQIEAPSIRLMEVQALTRRCDPIQALNHPQVANARPNTYHGASPQLVASPSRPIEGVVRDKQTGKPIAGAKVSSYRFGDTKMGNDTTLISTSDAQGHYRINGMPRGSGNELMALSQSDEPYFPTLSPLDDPPGLGAVSHDIELVRGTLIEGRITDRSTNEPVKACVSYHFAADNPYLDKVPGYRLLGLNGGYAFKTITQDDGTFRIAAFPGRGLIMVETVTRDYPGMDEEETILLGKYVPEIVGSCQAAVEIDLPQEVARQRQDIKLERGLTREATCLDPNDKPLKGAFVYGQENLGGWTSQPMKAAMFKVEALRSVDNEGRPGQIRTNDEGKVTWFPRTLVLFHKERKLAGWLDVRGNEPAGPLRVRLEPWATAVGRIVDSDGNPRADLTLAIRIVGKERLGGGSIPHLPDRVRTDAEGRFRIEGLAQGLSYRVSAPAPDGQRADRRIDIAATRSGETRALGDVTIMFNDAKK